MWDVGCGMWDVGCGMWAGGRDMLDMTIMNGERWLGCVGFGLVVAVVTFDVVTL
jgi:hypothetical protein